MKAQSMHNYDISNAIGNTPLVKLKNIVPENCASIYVKLEYYNPTGSYKDRMALAIIEEAEKRGALKPGMAVVECTGGSTGTSLAFVCSVKGYKFKVVSSDAFAKEKLQSMRLFGADLELFPSENGKITPNLIPRMIERAREISQQEGAYLTRQFENRDALEGYRVMGREILNQLDGPVNVFCAAVGTAGMITGVSLALREANPATKVIALEPASAPLISLGTKGSHKVDGIGVGFVPPLLNKNNYTDVMAIDEADARSMAKLLAAKEGIFAGTSSGMNVCAAIKIGKVLGPGHTIVTVACDSGMKYLAGGLFD
ncbi:PLP-dependent cysteine synthase family protein [Mucilaginibacter flavus]|uniref:PLP-dependent cysteine synthase family protein n=1 Tax=Mucilaginibacter flavus TaxID=931504 RepID=UPI0025B42688|nr:cysteine synthase family protein [Mucilaginibacter flavus]MDN3581150.1 cysteine synthase family protein [Mucilaginibacter flavus]